MSDLIKALRKLHEHYQETTGGNKLTIYAEAADALEATTARADAAEAKLERVSHLLVTERVDFSIDSRNGDQEIIAEFNKYGGYLYARDVEQALEEPHE